jgi:hypothetical protein
MASPRGVTEQLELAIEDRNRHAVVIHVAVESDHDARARVLSVEIVRPAWKSCPASRTKLAEADHHRTPSMVPANL